MTRCWKRRPFKPAVAIATVFFVLSILLHGRSRVSKLLIKRSAPFVANEAKVDREQSLQTVQAIPVLGVLVLNGDDLLVRFLRSIDYPVQKVVIFHNYDTDESINQNVRASLEEIQLKKAITLGHNYIREIIQLYRTSNLGFSAGVNKILTATPHAKFWIIANNDVAFHPGRLGEIAQVMHDPGSYQSSSCLWGLVGHQNSPYSMFVLTRRAVQTVGFFDENFWPAYAEDCDYTTRLVRARCSIVFESNTTRIATHEESASLKYASRGKSTLSKLVAQSGSGFNNFDYLQAKWGVNVCDLRLSEPPYMTLGGYDKPFNSSHFNQSTWYVDMQRRVSRGGPKECVVCDCRSPTLVNELMG